MDLLSLPVVMIENIVSYLPYDEIAKDRVVCKAFNEVCMRMLNRGFHIIDRRHAVALKTIKAQLPRRESERRYHPLSRHCDILSSIETRISMLNMTYSKYIDNDLCCFIPGKVIDEIDRVLRIVANSASPPRAHEFATKVLQELRDISSMAIEHFDERVSPALRKRLEEPRTRARPAHRAQDQAIGPFALKQELVHFRRQAAMNSKLSLYVASQYKKMYRQMLTYKKLSLRQRKTIKELKSKQTDQDAYLADLKKRIEECDIKYSELTHTNQAAGGKAIAGSSANTVGSSSGQPLRHFASQIKLDLSVLPIGTAKGKSLPNMKPRKPVIKMPSFSEDYVEPPPKLPKLDDPVNDRLAPLPATSNTQKAVKKRTQTTMAKIRGFAKEIRNLAKSSELNLSAYRLKRSELSPSGSRLKDSELNQSGSRLKGSELSQSGSRLNKRSVSFSALDDGPYASETKKQKMD